MMNLSSAFRTLTVNYKKMEKCSLNLDLSKDKYFSDQLGSLVAVIETGISLDWSSCALDVTVA